MAHTYINLLYRIYTNTVFRRTDNSDFYISGHNFVLECYLICMYRLLKSNTVRICTLRISSMSYGSVGNFLKIFGKLLQ